MPENIAKKHNLFKPVGASVIGIIAVIIAIAFFFRDSTSAYSKIPNLEKRINEQSVEIQGLRAAIYNEKEARAKDFQYMDKRFDAFEKKQDMILAELLKDRK